jgi:hypothetical protein
LLTKISELLKKDGVEFLLAEGYPPPSPFVSLSSFFNYSTGQYLKKQYQASENQLLELCFLIPLFPFMELI